LTLQKVKRRWDDDVVFKNCAKGDDKVAVKGFINDTLRSDFHKKFMERYIK
jgi:protein CWC15